MTFQFIPSIHRISEYRPWTQPIDVKCVRRLIGALSLIACGLMISAPASGEGTRPASLIAFGLNEDGQLGFGDTQSRTLPTPVLDELPWTQLSIGATHSCGISAGRLFCWGYNRFGQFGDGASFSAGTPAPVGAFSDWTFVSVGRERTCAIRDGGRLFCSGDNRDGGLGNGTTQRSTAFVEVAGGIMDWQMVASGADHSCALRRSGQLYCWGDNAFGQFGNGTRESYTTPVQVGTATWKSISSRSYTTCGIRSDGTLHCWGSNLWKQVDGGGAGTIVMPRQMSREVGWAAVSAGEGTVCALQSTGRIWCSGRNDAGQAGSGPVERSLAPVDENSDWTAVDVLTSVACGLRKGGEIWCWGEGPYLGRSESKSSAVPVRAETEAKFTLLGVGDKDVVGVAKP